MSRPAELAPRTVQEAPYFDRAGFALYNGDCVSVLARLPENSVDMIFADPPYNLSNGGFTVHAGRMVSVDKGEWDQSGGFDEDYAFRCRRALCWNSMLAQSPAT
jgi:site-specific DNA-methyltransferase (adenine-specific)